ncbi:hypothetical protein ABZ511_03705 [Nocardia gamkensis]|uniref:hypothetical protein n=1 Tax=Nocardia gamkensis TaxID=352869 RepID=UPI0033E82487
MPSSVDEVLIELVRRRPTLVAELLTSTLGLALPEFDHARVDSGDLPDIEPTEYRADLVVTLTDSQYFKQLYADGVAEGEAIGEAKGEAKALLTMLGARGFDVPAVLTAEIEACTDHARLTEWITRAATASALEEIFGDRTQ